MGAARGRPGGGGGSCLGVGRPGWGALQRPTARPWGLRPGPANHWLWPRGVWAWGPVPNPTARGLASWLCALWGRQEGAPGRCLFPGCVASGVWRSPTHDRPSLGRATGPATHRLLVRCPGVGSRYPWHLLPCRGSSFVVRASRVCGTPWPLLLGTGAYAVVVASGMLMWRASWPRVDAPRLIRSSSSRCSGRLPCRRGSFPQPGRLRGARRGWPRTGVIVPAAGPCRGRGAGLAPRRTRSGPRDGVFPGGFLRLRSWAACAAVVWCVWTRSLTRPVSCTMRLSTGDSAGAPGLFRVDADTSPFGSEDAMPGSRACVPVRALFGRVGRAGHPGAFWCASPFL